MSIHKTVLIKEAIEGLKLKNGDTVVDATLGGGGHSRKILEKIIPDGKLISIDQDKNAIQNFEKELEAFEPKLKEENVKLIFDNFGNLKNILDSLEIYSVNSIMADLGISSDQLEGANRGFSFNLDAELDMRMNQENPLSAKEIVNKYAEKDLIRIFRELGDEKYAGRIAKLIVEARKKEEIKKTRELVDLIERSVPENYKHQKIHFATRVFQALRIETNKELENLEKLISSAVEVLEKGGRLAVITFHSGEDKIVKNLFRENARGCICPPEFPICRCHRKPKLKIITKKPILPNPLEINENPRARSAKLRIAEKI